jgi:hypothetical protein
MSRYVAKISVCFQGFPNFAGGSTRHGRNMKQEKSLPFDPQKDAYSCARDASSLLILRNGL